MSFRIKVKSGFFLRNNAIEGSVKDTNDFRAFIVDDRMVLFVPEDRHSKPGLRAVIEKNRSEKMDVLPASIIFISLKVDVPYVLRIVNWIHVCTRKLIGVCKWPAVSSHPWRNHADS